MEINASNKNSAALTDNERNLNSYNHERSNSNKLPGSGKDSKKENVYDCTLNETSEFLDLDDSPLISTENLSKIKNLLSKNSIMCEKYFNYFNASNNSNTNTNNNNNNSNNNNHLNLNNNDNNFINNCKLNTKIFGKNILELFAKYFSNSEIDDFGMKMKDFLRKPHYMTSSYYNLISKLILNYFVDHDEKIYLLNSNNESRFIDCSICKKYQISSTNESINIDTDTIGYSNLTLENIKY